MVSTADVREIEEVIEELRQLLVKKLPGSQSVRAAWATVNECGRMVEFGKQKLERMAENPGEDELTKATRRHFLFMAHGEIYAATTIARKVADEFKVSNFKPGTVF